MTDTLESLKLLNKINDIIGSILEDASNLKKGERLVLSALSAKYAPIYNVKEPFLSYLMNMLFDGHSKYEVRRGKSGGLYLKEDSTDQT